MLVYLLFIYVNLFFLLNFYNIYFFFLRLRKRFNTNSSMLKITSLCFLEQNILKQSFSKFLFVLLTLPILLHDIPLLLGDIEEHIYLYRENLIELHLYKGEESELMFAKWRYQHSCNIQLICITIRYCYVYYSMQ